ncbi:MAG: AtpZ/AtpI family protein [Elusimicrobiales bacterium]
MIDKDWKKHLNLGIEIAVYVCVFVFSGYYLDKYLCASPFFLLLSTIFAIISVFYVMWKRYLKR